MAVGTNTYGTAAGVGKLVPKRATADGDTFDNVTSPLLVSVETWLNQVSGIVNTMLRQEGLAIPIAQADAKLAFDMFVQDEVAAIVEGVNGSGRFGPTASDKGKSRFVIIMEDVKMFIAEYATGLERLGVTQSEPISIGYLDQDESGDPVIPMFQREAYGYKDIEWDA